MNCGSCGAEANGKFCRHCGSPVKQEQQPQAPPIKSESIEAAARQATAQGATQAAPQAAAQEAAQAAPQAATQEAVQEAAQAARQAATQEAVQEAAQAAAQEAAQEAPQAAAQEADQAAPQAAAQEVAQAAPQAAAQAAAQGAVQAAPQAAAQEAAQAVFPAPSKSSLSGFIVSSAAAGIVLTLLIAGLAFGLNWVAMQGEFQEDLMFHVLSNVVHIPPEQAAYFISQLKSGAWLQLMFLHGGTIEGTYYIEEINGLISSSPIQLGLTLLLNAALGFVLIALVSRVIYVFYSKRKQSKPVQLLWVITLSAIYSIAMTSMLAIFSPQVKLAFGNMEYTVEFHVQFLQLLLVTFNFSLLASIIGTGRWTTGWKLDLSTWVKSMGRFAVTLVLFFIVIFGLMTLNWSTAKQSQLHSTEVITMGAVWDAYKHDPGVYGIIPNVMLQQFIYSLGGTWHVSSQSAADLLGVKQPVQLNMLSGATTSYGESDLSVQRFQQELRFHWFHLAFIIAFLFALSRIQFVKLWSYGATVLILIVATSVAAIGFNVRIAAGEVEQALIGFEFTSTIIQIGIVVALFLIMSYSLQYVLTKRRTTNEQ